MSVILDHLREARRINPKNPELYILRATRETDPKVVKLLLDEARKLDPNNARFTVHP